MKTTVTALLVMFFCTTAAFAASFQDNGNGTVTDLTTNLVWQQCSDGQSGLGCATGTVVTVTWENAIAYCEGLSLGGFTDWRLPTIKELAFFITPTHLPAFDNVYFPLTQSLYWSSTTYALNTSNAWVTNFDNGSTGYGDKTVTLYARCVRGQ